MKHKKNVYLEASILPLGRFKVKVKGTHGEPIENLDIYFVTHDTREEFGKATTDADGEAELSGPQITRLEVIKSLSSFIAIFHGNDEYLPAEAAGRIIAGA